MSRIADIAALGQQIWLDNITRSLLDSGRLVHWIVEDRLAGVTSNPSIFLNALKSDPAYGPELERIKTQTSDPEARFEALALADIRRACDAFGHTWRQSEGRAGFVSFEVPPRLAHDAEATRVAARRLWQAIARPNAMIKIPATQAGIAAVEDAIAGGINVNATLIFSRRQAAEVEAAHRRGLARRIEQGQTIDRLASVASVFVSRTDTLLDPRLPDELHGQTAVALCKLAYRDWQQRAPAFAALAAAGARRQRLLWGSTSTKNPAYRDVLYVEELIGPETVNTVPDATLAAFRDHGAVAPRLTSDVDAAAATLERVAALGVDLEAVGAELLDAGLKQFADAYGAVLELLA